MDLYSIYDFCHSLRFISGIIVVICLIECLSLLHKDTRNSFIFLDTIFDNIEKHTTKSIIIAFVGLIASFFVIFSNSQVIIHLGCDDLRLMPEGTYCYYVNATNENDKTYTVPAKISKGYDEYAEERGENVVTHTVTQYYVHKLYFNNGGYLYFEDADYIEYDDKLSSYDQKGNRWEVELTSEKTYHVDVSETNPKKENAIFFVFLKLLIIWLTVIRFIKKEYNEAVLYKQIKTE